MGIADRRRVLQIERPRCDKLRDESFPTKVQMGGSCGTREFRTGRAANCVPARKRNNK